MMIKTKFWGEVEINEEKIITLADGLIGFEEYKKYVMFPHEKDANFQWLQSAETPFLCFLITTPLSFMFDYSIEITDNTVEKLKITAPEDVAIYCLVTVPEDPLKISANLAGPLIINANELSGEQVVIMDPKYSIKHYILDELRTNAPMLIENISNTLMGGMNVETPAAKQEESIFAGGALPDLEEAMKVCNSLINQ